MDLARGYAQPLFVGDELYNTHLYQNTASNVNNSINISYLISSYNGKFEITAEGIYHFSTGSLCMIGCRKNFLNSTDTLDCEILVQFKFPPSDYSNSDSSLIMGTIESKRKNSDPLHFTRLNLSSASYGTIEMKESIRMVDHKIILALVSNTLDCVFAAFQIFHLRRNHGFHPFVSLTMLFTLSLGCVISLARDLESMLGTSFESGYVLLGTGGWFQANGVIEVTMRLILLVLLLRLLNLVWSARLSHENKRELQIAENESLIVTLPLYFGGAFLCILYPSSKRNQDLVRFSSSLLSSNSNNPIWEALKSFVDTLSDIFLLPQILLNLFRDSTEKALSVPFYIGTTLVRLLPCIYGFYKARDLGFESISTIWDVIVPFVGLLFAATVSLQQKFHGRCILTFRFKKPIIHKVIAEAEN